MQSGVRLRFSPGDGIRPKGPPWAQLKPPSLSDSLALAIPNLIGTVMTKCRGEKLYNPLVFPVRDDATKRDVFVIAHASPLLIRHSTVALQHLGIRFIVCLKHGQRHAKHLKRVRERDIACALFRDWTTLQYRHSGVKLPRSVPAVDHSRSFPSPHRQTKVR